MNQSTEFKPIIRSVTLAPDILVCARTRVEGCWRAYIASTVFIDHERPAAIGTVLDYGTKLEESIARALFPGFADLPYKVD